ncbi:AraC family transcriptional regulator [Chitinimonas naiadis]
MPERSRDAADYQHVPRPVTAMAKDYPHGTQVPAHTHPRAQLLYAAQGVMRVHTPDRVWTIPPQRALWVPPGVEHRLTTMSPVAIRTVYVAPDAATLPGQDCRVLSVTPLLHELILSLIDEPIEYPLPGRGEHMAALILAEIAAAPTVPIAIPWPRDRRLLAVCEAIMDRPGNQHGIEDWTATAGASGRTLIRLFPRETGLHYRQWVQQVHLADALCRLDQGESIARIASALGYASPSAFSAMFRKALGVAPTQYLTRR